MNYWTRLRDVIIFLILWMAIPVYLEQCRDESTAVYWLLIVTWIPAIIITLYLNDT